MPHTDPLTPPMIMTTQALYDDNPDDFYYTWHQVNISGQLMTLPDQRGLSGKTIWVEYQWPDGSWHDLFSFTTGAKGKWRVVFNGYLGFEPGAHIIRTKFAGTSKYKPSSSMYLTLTFKDGKLPSFLIFESYIKAIIHHPFKIEGDLVDMLGKGISGEVFLYKSVGGEDRLIKISKPKGKKSNHFVFSLTEETLGTHNYRVIYNGNPTYDGCAFSVLVDVRDECYLPGSWPELPH